MIINETKGKVWHGRVYLADTLFRRFRGLMLVGDVSYSLVFILPAETRANASIHTFFMLDEVDVIWLNSLRRVVDFRRAKRWRLYTPRKAAKYVIEGPVGLIKALEVEEGDLINWVPTERRDGPVPAGIPLPKKVSLDGGSGVIMTEGVKEVRTENFT